MKAFRKRPIAMVFLVSLSLLLISGIYRHFTKIQALGQGVQKSQGFPVRLKIPSINVDAHIEPVGVNHKGVMDIPASTKNVGWFNLGPKPGEFGSAVIAGHFDDKNGNEAVFYNLDKLKMGDYLYIENDRGEELTFEVKKSRKYDPGFAEEIFSSNDNVHLNLVTCDGEWDKSTNSYDRRLIVFADIVN